MSSTDDIIVCANCGKGEGEESAGDLKSCTACKLVNYCNRDCQIAHRSQHKKACKKHVLLNCTMKRYLKNPRRQKIVQFVCCLCLLIRGTQLSNLVVVRLSAMVVFMR